MHDNLKGFTEANSTVFTQADMQTCIAHQIHNSLNHVEQGPKGIYAKLKAGITDSKY